MKEIKNGRPTAEQLAFYRSLGSAWRESGWLDAFPLEMGRVREVETGLISLGLSDADRLHVAQAKMLNAAWFLTNDKALINKCLRANLPFKVGRPSECVEGISVGLFLEGDQPAQ